MVEDKHVNSTAVCKNHLYLSHAAPLSLLPPPPLVGVGSVCTPSSWEPEGGAEGGKSRYGDLGLPRQRKRKTQPRSRPVLPVFDGAPDLPPLLPFDEHLLPPPPREELVDRHPLRPYSPPFPHPLRPSSPRFAQDAYRASTSLHRHDDGARQGVRGKVLRAAGLENSPTPYLPKPPPSPTPFTKTPESL